MAEEAELLVLTIEDERADDEVWEVALDELCDCGTEVELLEDF